MKNRARFWVPCVVFILLATTVPGWAQRPDSASISGTVTDSSGAVMPGVTVTASSPALLAPQLEVVTDVDGLYRLINLPEGTYRVSYSIQGFHTTVREGIVLTNGFAAKVDIALKIGNVEETVVVSGAAPTVDVTSTRGGQSLSDEALNMILPTNRTYQDVSQLVSGMVTTTPPKVGQIGQGNVPSFTTYGLSTTQVQTQIDGADTYQVNATPDFSTAEEMNVVSYGGDAEVANPGVLMSMIVKSGGNEFHGRSAYSYLGKGVQWSNVAPGTSNPSTNTLNYYHDANTDLGGPVIRDKIWFYGAFRVRKNERSILGYVMAPPGRPGDMTPVYPHARQYNYTAKLSYQLTPKYQVIGFYTQENRIQEGISGGPTRSFESASHQFMNPITYYAKFRGMLSSRLFFEVSAGRNTYHADYYNPGAKPSSGENWTPSPSKYNASTGMYSGDAISINTFPGLTKRPRLRWESSGNAHYLTDTHKGGAHEFKVGYRIWLQQNQSLEPNYPAGNYLLTYVNSPAVSTPSTVTTYNFPVSPLNPLNQYSVYQQDAWRVSKSLTLTLGLRWDYTHAFYPSQCKEQGEFGSSGCYDAVDLMSWLSVAPRLGVAYDLGGKGTSVVKGFYGQFNYDLAEDFAVDFNPNAPISTTYRWTDPTGCNCYVPGTVDLSTTGPAFLSTVGATSNVLNPDLKQPYVRQFAASFEREVAANTAVRVGYVYNRIKDDYQWVNTLRPNTPEVWSVPVVKSVPNEQGVIVAGAPTITLYDYGPAYRGSAFVRNMQVNRPSEYEDYFQTIEGAVTKRGANWTLLTSFSATKNHRWISGSGKLPVPSPIPVSPNFFFPLDSTWSWAYKVSGSSELPLGLRIGWLVNILNGTPGQVTYTFTGLPQSSTMLVPLGPFGAVRGPVRPIANLRVSKVRKLRETRTLQFDFDLLNVINSGAAWARTYLAGRSYGTVTSIDNPRIARFGVTIDF